MDHRKGSGELPEQHHDALIYWKAPFPFPLRPPLLPLGLPFDVAFANNDLLVADLANKKLRLITAAGADYQVSTVSNFDTGPRGVAVSPDGSFVLVALTDAIWKVTGFRSLTPNVEQLAGGTYGTADGNGLAAGFQLPSSLMLTPDGNSVLIAGVASHRVRELR